MGNLFGTYIGKLFGTYTVYENYLEHTVYRKTI